VSNVDDDPEVDEHPVGQALANFDRGEDKRRELSTYLHFSGSWVTDGSALPKYRSSHITNSSLYSNSNVKWIYLLYERKMY
jgi:hypothetical protein